MAVAEPVLEVQMQLEMVPMAWVTPTALIMVVMVVQFQLGSLLDVAAMAARVVQIPVAVAVAVRDVAVAELVVQVLSWLNIK